MCQLCSEKGVGSSQVRMGSPLLGGTKLLSAFDGCWGLFTSDASPRVSLQVMSLRTGLFVLGIGVLNGVVGFGNTSQWKQASPETRLDIREFLNTDLFGGFSAKEADLATPKCLVNPH